MKSTERATARVEIVRPLPSRARGLIIISGSSSLRGSMFRKTKRLQLNSLQTIFTKSLDYHKYNNVSSSQFAPTVRQIIFIIIIKYAKCKEVSKRFDFQSKIRFLSSIPTQRLNSVTCIFCLSSEGVYMRKLAPARVSYRDDFFISYRVYIMTGSFHISSFEGTLHVDKIHVTFKIASITHALPIPVYQQTDFTPKLVVVSCLYDTVEFTPG